MYKCFMKTLLFILILLPSVGFSQDSLMHKNDIYIHLACSDSNKHLMKSFGQFLMSNGYTIATVDTTFLTVKTGFIKAKKGNGFNQIVFSVTGHEIKAKVMGKLGASLNFGSAISNDDEMAISNSWVSHKYFQWFSDMVTLYKHNAVYYTHD